MIVTYEHLLAAQEAALEDIFDGIDYVGLQNYTDYDGYTETHNASLYT